jgi:GTP-binding protein HflX
VIYFKYISYLIQADEILGGIFIPQLFGNTTGLKPSQIKSLERIYRRKIPPAELITAELTRLMTSLSRDLNRQIGVIITRKGTVAAAIIGDEKEIFIPDLSAHPIGRKHLRGLRCVHTHLKNEPLSPDDLTDLALLRLDCMAAIGVSDDGLPLDLHMANLVPFNTEGRNYEIHKGVPFHMFHTVMDEFFGALEAEMGRAIVRKVKDASERAILVSVSKKSKHAQLVKLTELEELSRTSNIEVLESICQRPQKLNPKYLMGSGKIKELVILALQNEATMLIFDQELSPTQIREIGDITELKVIDRTQLILDIFASRALSKDGKVQVELAQLRYLLPRLTGKGTAMSRLMGGIGGKGPGETKLETDRRRIDKRISSLEKSLKSLSRGRRERRKRRAERGVPIISIVGYTNAGKSTLLNTLTGSKTLVEDKLFATLDTASRRLRFPREREVVVTDTVGFIDHLPKELMKAFKATLEEMEDADLLLHLVDISDPAFERHITTVEDILREIHLDSIPRLMVLNKSELVAPVIAANLARRFKGVAISALDKGTLGELMETLGMRLWPEDAINEALTEAY